MLTQIDRLLIHSYLKTYLVCLISFLGLYVVVDLFTNIDDFAQHGRGLLVTVSHIGAYYGYKLTQIFDRLSEAIVLLAAMFTVAWLQRNNEMLPLLSAGVSVRRVVRPVLGTACVMLSLTVLNQELVIPRIIFSLQAARDDPNGEKEIDDLQGAYEPNGIHVHGSTALRKGMIVKGFHCVLPVSLTGNLLPLSAREARYIPPDDRPHSGGWLLTGVQAPPELEHWDDATILEMIDPGKYFLYTKEVDFDLLTRNRNWFQLASTAQLHQELQKSDSTRLSSMAVMFHMRLTRPILGLILVFLGLSVILRDQNRNMFISAGLCLVLCAVFFGACFACKNLGDNEYLAPALAAWLPVLAFGPLGFALFDAIHT